MRPLLVPVNFSDCSSCAARYAADLAMAIDGEVHLVNVIDIDNMETIVTPSVYDTMVETAQTYLDQLKTELLDRTRHKVPVETFVTVGTVYGEVEAICRTIKPYAVVLGTSGPSFEKAIAGSPVGSLLHLPYPVLVVPDQESFHTYHNIVLACELDDLETGIPHFLPFIQELRHRFHAQIDIVTIENWKGWPGEEYFLRTEAWKTRLKDLDPEWHLIHEKKVEQGLFGFLANHRADLVVVFPKKHTVIDFHISQSRKIAKHSDVPVMSLHE